MGTWTLLLQNNTWLCSNVEKDQTSNPDINHDEELSSSAQCLTKPDKLKIKKVSASGHGQLEDFRSVLTFSFKRTYVKSAYLLWWKCKRIVSIQTEVPDSKGYCNFIFVSIAFVVLSMLYQILDWRDLYFSKLCLPTWLLLLIPVASHIFRGFSHFPWLWWSS